MKSTIEELLDQICGNPEIPRLAELVEKANKFTEEYQASLLEKLKDTKIPEGIAILAKTLYDSSLIQVEISNRLCELKFSHEDENSLLNEEKDEVSRISSELVRAYLRLVVLSQAISRGCESSVGFLIQNHARNQVSLNLDTDMEKN